MRGVVIKPNLQMCEELAILLGIIKGDGCLFINGYASKVYISCGLSEGFANEAMRLLKHIDLNPKKKLISPRKGQPHWRVEVYAKIFTYWLLELDTNRLIQLLNTPALRLAFWQGMFKADGCLWKSKAGYKFIEIHNTDEELLRFGIDCLTEQEYHPKFYTASLRVGQPTQNIVCKIGLYRQEEVKRLIDNGWQKNYIDQGLEIKYAEEDGKEIGIR